jgi:hypothetical protein
LIAGSIVSSPWFWGILIGTLIAVAHRRKQVLDLLKGKIGIRSEGTRSDRVPKQGKVAHFPIPDHTADTIRRMEDR